jgi:hypothetical protein
MSPVFRANGNVTSIAINVINQYAILKNSHERQVLRYHQMLTHPPVPPASLGYPMLTRQPLGATKSRLATPSA